MQLLGVLALACLLCSALTLVDSTFDAETVREGDKSIMIVRDKETGMVVTEINVFEQQEYQLVKPVNEDICLVAGFFMKAAYVPNKPACFKRVRAPEDMLEKLHIGLSACKDRQVAFLKPTLCRPFDVNGGDKPGFRQKRACSERQEVVSFCVKYRHECIKRNFWGKCKEYTNLCVEQGHRIVTTIDCS